MKLDRSIPEPKPELNIDRILKNSHNRAIAIGFYSEGANDATKSQLIELLCDEKKIAEQIVHFCDASGTHEPSLFEKDLSHSICEYIKTKLT